jgi:hypothetical protein
VNRYAGPAADPKGAAKPSRQEKIMRSILLAGLALAVSACGGGTEATDANAAADNMMMDPNMMTDQNMMLDPNMSMNGMDTMNGMTGAGAGTGGAVDANTQNMMLKDATTNDPDTNLANGM